MDKERDVGRGDGPWRIRDCAQPQEQMQMCSCRSDLVVNRKCRVYWCLMQFKVLGFGQWEIVWRGAGSS